MTPDRSILLLALVEANKALASAHAAALRLRDPNLATYIADLAADTFSTMAEVSRGRYAAEQTEAVCS